MGKKKQELGSVRETETTFSTWEKTKKAYTVRN